jgi:acyl-CoA thioester hydrolase
LPVPFVHELRVRYGECDPQGIVFNANYLVYFDVAFTELWREAVGPWKLLHDHGIDAVVAEANLDFKAPARDDEILSLHARVTRLGSTSITTEIDYLRDADLLVRARLRHVCVARETWMKTDVPQFVREGLRHFCVEGAGAPQAEA